MLLSQPENRALKRTGKAASRTVRADHRQMRGTATCAQLKRALPALGWQRAICKDGSAAGRPYPISGLIATYPLADFKRPPNPSYLKDNRAGTPEHTRTGTRESHFCKATGSGAKRCGWTTSRALGGPSVRQRLLFPEVGPLRYRAKPLI